MALKIGLCQIETVPGDVPSNVKAVIAAARAASDSGVDLCVFPELTIIGYGHRDLILRQGVLDACEAALETVKASRIPVGILLGMPFPRSGPGRPFSNGAVLLESGREIGRVKKRLLPTYDVFDESRWFEPDVADAVPLDFRGERLGILICEDLWPHQTSREARGYSRDPATELARNGATLLLNISASPWHSGKAKERAHVVASTARRTGLATALVNLVGGNDDVVFDGHSVACAADGRILALGEPFAPGTTVFHSADKSTSLPPPDDSGSAARHDALVLGIRSFFCRIGVTRAHLGLSGGIDSAVVACLAVAALGKESVRGFALPSQFSSQGSIDDAWDLARRLGIRCDTIQINDIYERGLDALEPCLREGTFGIMEENLQSRVRGLLMMAVSNREHSLLLSTGNKSELATGYATLYGDMCGGLAPISDVLKTEVYALAYEINSRSNVIPEASLTKAPSAELRPNQTDQDSLPPYETLDRILRLHLEEDEGIGQLVSRGEDRSTVERILSLVARAEFKRHQAPPGLRVSKKAFGSGRNIAIAVSDLSWLDER